MFCTYFQIIIRRCKSNNLIKSQNIYGQANETIILVDFFSNTFHAMLK